MVPELRFFSYISGVTLGPDTCCPPPDLPFFLSPRPPCFHSKSNKWVPLFFRFPFSTLCVFALLSSLAILPERRWRISLAERSLTTLLFTASLFFLCSGSCTPLFRHTRIRICVQCGLDARRRPGSKGRSHLFLRFFFFAFSPSGATFFLPLFSFQRSPPLPLVHFVHPVQILLKSVFFPLFVVACFVIVCCFGFFCPPHSRLPLLPPARPTGVQESGLLENDFLPVLVPFSNPIGTTLYFNARSCRSFSYDAPTFFFGARYERDLFCCAFTYLMSGSFPPSPKPVSSLHPLSWQTVFF